MIGRPTSELSALPSAPNPIAYSPLPNSGDFNHFLAVGPSLSDTVQFQGVHHPPSNQAAIPTSGFCQWQGGMAAPGFLVSTHHPGLPAANNSAWTSSSAGLMFEGYHQFSPNLDQDLNNTGVDSVPLEIFHSTAVPEMPLNTALPIPPSGGSEAQPEKRHKCNVDGCDVSTARHSDLQRHMRVHSTSPHKCQFCLKEIFNRPDKIKDHLEKYHKFDLTVLRDRHDLWK